ncbi:MAG TPA: gas vesicle protein GvpJ [Tepidisphaeraceae bacterium]|nr:gas vesicle protein GvpJ [Tepidisphaeraceae bacterium]
MIEQGSSLVRRDPQIRRAPNSAGLYDVLDLILDKGLVIDAFVRVSLVGIELLTVDLRVVIASVDTYLRYAEGAERLQLYERSGSKRLGDIAKSTSKSGVIKKGIEKAGEVLEGNGRHRGQEEPEHEEQEEQEREREPVRGHHEGVAGTITKGVRNVVGKIVDTVAGGDDDEHEQEHRHPKHPERHPVRGNGNAGRTKAGARR